MNSESLIYPHFVSRDSGQDKLTIKNMTWQLEATEAGGHLELSDLSLGYPLVKLNTTRADRRISASAGLSDGAVLTAWYHIPLDNRNKSVEHVGASESSATAFSSDVKIEYGFSEHYEAADLPPGVASEVELIVAASPELGYHYYIYENFVSGHSIKLPEGEVRISARLPW